MDSIEFNLGSSLNLFIILTLGFVLAIGVIFTVPFNFCVKYEFFLKIGLCTVLLWYWIYTVTLHARKSQKNSILRIWQDEKGRWGCQDKKGKAAFGDILGSSFISHTIIILRFKQFSRKINIVIPRDAMNVEEYRLLCARLQVLIF